MPTNRKIENKMWNIHKMEYRAAMRLNDLITGTCKMPSVHLGYVPFFKYLCCNSNMIIKEAAAEIAAPIPRYTQAGWGHKSGSLCSSSGGLPLAVSLSSPREEVCSLWRTRNRSCRRKRRGGMHGQGTKSSGCSQVNILRWNASGTLPEFPLTFTTVLEAAKVLLLSLDR